MRRAVVHLCMTVVGVGCGAGGVDLDLGDRCELSEECEAPLVCRLGRCRAECRERRDCPVGLDCLLDARGLGACQVVDDTECLRSSDCAMPLVCRERRCTNECVEDRDCFAGARCLPDGEGTLGCLDMADMDCHHDSDCTAPFVCARDGLCREQCVADRDCRDGLVCNPGPPAVCHPRRPPPSARLVAGGEAYTCAVRGRETRCWGDDGFGQLATTGPATNTAEATPTDDIGLVSVLACWERHCCAQRTAGLVCWGDNTYGQLATPAGGTWPPTPVTLSSPAYAIGIGSRHTCILDAAGAVLCWGGNNRGQLGDGTVTDRATPGQVSGLPAAVVDITTGTLHNCALGAGGGVFCWGSNLNGQLGDAAVTMFRATPGAVAGVDSAVEVAAGGGHTCARLTLGTVQCWGSGLNGQLGDGLAAFSATPVDVDPALGDVVSLSLGLVHSCAVRSSGGVACWGHNSRGQTGSVPGFTVGLPTDITGLPEVVELAVGAEHSCARTATGDILCWGSNRDGQLGNGSTGGMTPPPPAAPVIWR